LHILKTKRISSTNLLASNKIIHSDFKEGDQNKFLKNQSLIGIAFIRDFNLGSSLLKLNTIEGILIEPPRSDHNLIAVSKVKLTLDKILRLCFPAAPIP
jgi:hypothetical protein